MAKLPDEWGGGVMLDDKQRAMLDEFGIFVLPETIEHETYQTMVEVVKRSWNSRFDLYCRGNGGDSRSALAIVDLLEWHGNVRGVLMSEAVSSHAVIWAGCAKRLMGDSAALGIHEVAIYPPNPMDGNYARLTMLELERVNRKNASVFERSSNKSAEWWLEKITAARSGGAIYFQCQELFEMKMGGILMRPDGDRASDEREVKKDG